MESTIALYKTELIKKDGPWRSVADVELANAGYVDWFNHKRLHTAIGGVPPPITKPPTTLKPSPIRRLDPTTEASTKLGAIQAVNTDEGAMPRFAYVRSLACSLNAPSTGCATTGRWPPGTTSATSSTAEPSTSPPSHLAPRSRPMIYGPRSSACRRGGELGQPGQGADAIWRAPGASI
jgi:hypothetical protein